MALDALMTWLHREQAIPVERFLERYPYPAIIKTFKLAEDVSTGATIIATDTAADTGISPTPLEADVLRTKVLYLAGPRNRFYIGRHKTNAIAVPNHTASSPHVVIEQYEDRTVIEDRSKNGTVVEYMSQSGKLESGLLRNGMQYQFAGETTIIIGNLRLFYKPAADFQKILHEINQKALGN